MKRLFTILGVFAVLLCGIAVAQKPADTSDESQKRLVDIKGDIMYPIKVADSSALCIVGNVAFYHNGTVITCDSAIRYSENYMVCHKNVLLNKDSTYAYGDRADYNGQLNQAQIYSSLIKVRNGNALLYTNNFKFNTKDNLGEFWGMGVVFDGDNTIESDRGYFYADQNIMVCVDKVQLKNSEYRMKADSISYNTDTDEARFYTRSYIWNNKDEILSADRGVYNNQTKVYSFIDKAYILTDTREVWADTLEYYGESENVDMYGNIQILDKEHSTMGFGDLGKYWNERGQTLLTHRPSIFTYDKQTGDTTYMRADTMFLYVYYPSDFRDSTAQEAKPERPQVDQFAHLRWIDSLEEERRLFMADSLIVIFREYKARMDSMRIHADSVELWANPEELAKVQAEKARKDSIHKAERALLDSVNSLDDKAKRKYAIKYVKALKAAEKAAKKERLAAEKAAYKAKLEADRIKLKRLDSLNKIKRAKEDSIFKAKEAIADSIYKAEMAAKKAEEKARRLENKAMAAAQKNMDAMREALSDSTAVVTDSTIVRLDSTANVLDSLAVAVDSTLVAVDSALVRDSLAKADSLAKIKADSAARADSVAQIRAQRMAARNAADADSVSSDQDSVRRQRLAERAIVADSTAQANDSTAQPLDSVAEANKPAPHIVPPEVTEIRRQIDSLRPKADSVKQVEGYIRKTLPPVEVVVDTAELLRQDSLRRADSLRNVDSLKFFNPKAYKAILKRQKARIKAQQKAVRDSLRKEKERLREERYIAKLKKKGMWTAPDSIATDSLDSLVVAPADSVVVAVDSTEMEQEVDTIERVIRGFHNVRLYKSNVQAVSDSIAAFSKDSTIVMYKSPVMWNGLNQITSTKTTFYTNGEAIDRGYFEGDPIMASQVDKDHFNQVAGKTMTAFFRNNNVYRNDVNSNAQALYWMQEEGSPDIIAYATLIAADITFLLANQMVTHINGYTNSEWTIYPPEMVPDDVPTVLDWFKWQPELKPTREDVFDRVLVPSERERYEKMEHPRFPISRRINSKREHLQKYYHWVDRNDVLTDQTLEWVNAVKREYGHE
ncbi:MAG: hypothetical protein J6K81_00570 [Rikenellaceae bacterium]|nr:hypothetical protein [Rikenellaceae bacterium]